MKDITLFISEKPTLGRTIAEGIGIVKSFKTHVICKNNCVVVFAQGHVFELLKPDDYDPRYKTWRREDLPFQIDKLRYMATPSTLYRVKAMQELLKHAKRVINLGDPDREGQAIVDIILNELGWTGPVERMWNTDPSTKGVQKDLQGVSKGFPSNNEPRYANRGAAAQARAELDWWYGYVITRAIAHKLRSYGNTNIVSYGRLQSTVLNIIVLRERERRNFKPKTFYGPTASINGIDTSFIHDEANFPDGYDTEGYLINKKVADAICALADKKQGVVQEYSKTKKSESPPLPYDLSKLIQDASRTLNMSAKEVNDIAQSLYDKKITTYPRVDCRYLPDNFYAEASDIMSSLKGLPGADNANLKIKGKCFNSKKTDAAAHHAIIPTGESWKGLSGKELGVFKLVAQGYILQFHPDRQYESQSLIVAFEGPPKTLWKANGTKDIDMGWRLVLKDDEDNTKDNEIPLFKKGETVTCDNAFCVTSETKKPPAFTEASIINAMENIDKFEPNPEFKKMLREVKGIGTNATRGSLLELLQKRKFITITKRVIAPTQYGEEVISCIPEKLCSPALTALMEERLNEIVDGNLSKEDFIQEARNNLPDFLKDIDDMKLNIKSIKTHSCPTCNTGNLIRFKAKNDNRYFWKCQNPDCAQFFMDNKEKPVMPTECPSCHAKAVNRIKAKSGAFYHRCGSCQTNFADDKGKCGRAFGDEETTPCPTCDQQAVRIQSKVAGRYFWKCKGQCGNFADDNGVIGKNFNDYSDYKQDKCPICNGVAVQLTSKKGSLYWKCTKDKTHGPFSDTNGFLGQPFGEYSNNGLEEVPCPHCKGKNKAAKHESKNKPGVFYWRCQQCGLMSDQGGVPGAQFGDKPKQTTKTSKPSRKK